MLRILINFQSRFQAFTVLLLASNTSARPSLTAPETISSPITTDIHPNHIVSSLSNSTSPVDHHDDKRSHIMQSNFVIAAIVFTSFCVLGLFLQHRWKIHSALKKRDAEDTDDGIDVRMARLNDTNTPDNCQTPRNREDMLYEGRDLQEDAPPPYTLSSKPLGIREGNGITVPPGTINVTNSDQELTSLEPPAYHEHVISLQNQNVGDLSISRTS
ncbi:hypothetical protein EPUL_003122 [Erysiphe pulchra]|uniref:Uncharacterized protein n=1 Tax=Erysiphe pulchra TaxID=225359 RepID=A0A2S4PT34_9PEZI|nr:hypothetical protein EPUL_003122 [Erysiphe pulchra]